MHSKFQFGFLVLAVIFFPNILDPCFVDSADVEPMDMEDQLFCIILYKGLEHLRILVSKGVLEPIPQRYQGTSVISTIRVLG